MLAIALVAILVVLALSPLIQTWVAQMALARTPALQGSLESVVARFGRVEIAGLEATGGGVNLKVPSLAAEFPIISAFWHRRLSVRRLVAKGWTLDLSGRPASGGAAGPAGPAAAAAAGAGAQAPAPAVTAQEVAGMIRGALTRWVLPCDLSLDGIDLEGDVLVGGTSAGAAPTRVHVIVNGGGMAAGHDGSFAVDIMTQLLDAEPAVVTLGAHGQLVVAMRSPRTFKRFAVKADLTAEGGPFPKPVALTTELAATLDAGGETYTLDVSRSDRQLAAVAARFLGGSDRLAGTWKLDLQDSDVACFVPDRPLPGMAAAGNGEFDADVTFAAVHARGRLSGAIPPWNALAPFLERFGAGSADARFDVVRSGKSLRVDQLTVSLAGTGPTAVVQALQPFQIDAMTGELKLADSAHDWLNISIRGFPLDRLAGLTDGFALSGGDAAGECTVRTEKGRFELRSKSPFTATGVVVTRAGKIIGRALDLSLSVLADYGPHGWHVEAEPLKIASSGGQLAEFEVKASRPAEPDQPITLKGAWKADLQAPALKEAVPALGYVGGRSASGDFSATVGASGEFDGKLAIVGRDERRSLTASVHATVDDGGRISFQAPLKIAFGPSVSDLSVDGTLIRGEAATQVYLKLNGKDVVLDHLRLLAGAVAAVGGLPPVTATGQEGQATVRDQAPFWGKRAGRLLFEFDRLNAGSYVFDHVGGGLQVDQRSVHLEGGHGALADHRFANVEGSLSFDAAAELPYSLKATASLEPVEVGSFFSGATSGAEPLIEGRFSIAGTLAGNGINLSDLVRRTQEEARLTSTAGIVRVFKTDVDEATPPDKESMVDDTLGRVGSAVGTFFGVEGAGSGRRSVSPTLQAALDVINETSEIGFDECKLTVVRGVDRTIRLVDIAMTAGDERVTGSGQITYVEGRPLRAQPLRVELQFGARGRMAKLMSAAGLLSAQKDDGGYTLLSEPIVFGGTLEHLDRTAWHNLLVKSAKRSPAGAKQAPDAHH